MDLQTMEGSCDEKAKSTKDTQGKRSRSRDVASLPEIVRTRKSSHSCMVNAWSSRSCSASKARATMATSDQKTSFHGSRIRVTG